MELIYILTLLSISAWLVFFVLLLKRIKRIEEHVRALGVRHSLVEGNEINPIAFYIGLMRVKPSWVSKEKEIENDVLSYIWVSYGVFAFTFTSGLTAFGALWNILNQ